jgi:hypothetical protein
MQKELLMIVAVVLGGALVVYKWSGSPLKLHSTRGMVNVEATSEPAPKASDKAAERKTSRRKMDRAIEPRTASDQPTSQPGAVPSPAGTTPTPKPDRPFPTPETLTNGTSTAEIRATFGVPAIDIAGMRDGRVIERYYYVNRDRSRLTVVTMENGRLTSADSLSSPYFELPGALEPERVANSKAPR